jgi:C4-dicarboxylate-specific signal transduction histidine kinase
MIALSKDLPRNQEKLNNKLMEGDRLMNEIRNYSNNWQQEETNHMNEHIINNQNSMKNALLVFIALLLLIVFLLVSAFMMFRRDLAGRAKAERLLFESNSKLSELNNSLEMKVRQRTEDLKRTMEDVEAKVTFRNLELEKLNLENQEKIRDMKNEIARLTAGR